ncbi:response regulator [Cellvibrio sp.]|uniref:response regulator n=1 Tax=Cellvibrio sp. TaxID=1965322 RepID=UPI00374EB59D
MKAQVMLVDDHAMVRQGMSSLINSEPDLEVISEAESADQALERLAAEQKIDIVLLDLTLRDVADLDLIHKINIQFPDLPILVVSMHNERVYAERALKSGARGYVMKQEPGEILIAAIREVLKGNIFLSPSMTSLFLNRNIKRKPEPEQLINQLTRSEIEILQMIASGLGSQEIAALKNRSIKTIEAHRANIRLKLNLKNSADLIRYATLKFSQPESAIK